MPDIRTRQELDELGARGIQEMETYGHSYAYQQYLACLSARWDELLPDLSLATAIPRSIEETADLLAESQITNQRFFRPGFTDPLIVQMGWQDVPVNELRDNLSMALIDAPNHQRPAIMKALAAIDNSGHESMTTTISYDIPESHLTIEANPTDDSLDQDGYSLWRSNVGDGALSDLTIKPSVSNDPLFSGITTMNNDGGGVYEVNSDWVYQQSVAASSGGSDDE